MEIMEDFYLSMVCKYEEVSKEAIGIYKKYIAENQAIPLDVALVLEKHKCKAHAYRKVIEELRVKYPYLRDLENRIC